MTAHAAEHNRDQYLLVKLAEIFLCADKPVSRNLPAARCRLLAKSSASLVWMKLRMLKSSRTMVGGRSYRSECPMIGPGGRRRHW